MSSWIRPITLVNHNAFCTCKHTVRSNLFSSQENIISKCHGIIEHRNRPEITHFLLDPSTGSYCLRWLDAKSADVWYPVKWMDFEHRQSWILSKMFHDTECNLITSRKWENRAFLIRLKQKFSMTFFTKIVRIMGTY